MSTLGKARRGADNDSQNQGGPWRALVGLGGPWWAWGPLHNQARLTSAAVGGFCTNFVATRVGPAIPWERDSPGFLRATLSSRGDAAETLLLAPIDQRKQGPSQALCSVRGANCRAVQPFFHNLLLVCAACQTEIGACYRIAHLPKSPALPFSSELVGDKQATSGTVLWKS